MPEQNQTNISWQAHEFRHYEKNLGWYMALFAIGAMLVGFFIIQKDIFAAISLGIITLLIFFFSKHQPELITIELTEKGVKFGKLSVPHKQIKHFWIVNNNNHKTLNLHTTALLNNILVVQLADRNPEEIRNFLVRFVPEHPETEETFAQKIMHTFKF